MEKSIFSNFKLKIGFLYMKERSRYAYKKKKTKCEKFKIEKCSDVVKT